MPRLIYSLIPSSVPADGSSGFKAETGRYHIYVSLACPWAHRTLIVRKIKGLEDVISVTVVDWFLAEKGWNFTDQVSIINTMISLLSNCFDTIIILYIFLFIGIIMQFEKIIFFDIILYRFCIKSEDNSITKNKKKQ